MASFAMEVMNVPFPLFDLLDGIMGTVAPSVLRLSVWAVLGGGLSMGLYALLSAQEKIARISGEATRARQALAAYDHDFKGLWPLVGRSLSLSLRHLGLALAPALVAGVPLVSLMAWVSVAYGHRFPVPGDLVTIEATPSHAAVQCVPEPCPVSGDGLRQVPWPGSHRVRLLDDAAHEIVELPPAVPITSLHKRRWWNVVLGNPAGYVPDDVLVDQIQIALPVNEYLGFGPPWMRSWQSVFLVVLTTTSLIIKFAFRLR